MSRSCQKKRLKTLSGIVPSSNNKTSYLWRNVKWRTRICLDVSKSALNAEDEAWTKAFHHHHRLTLTVVTHIWKGLCLSSFGCTLFDHEIHILWATSHLEGTKGFMYETLTAIKTRHVHQTPLKLYSEEIQKCSLLSECLKLSVVCVILITVTILSIWMSKVLTSYILQLFTAT